MLFNHRKKAAVAGNYRNRSVMKRIISIAAHIGTLFCVMILVWSCATVPGLKDEEPGSFIRVPFVRVLLTDSQERVLVDADGSMAIDVLSCTRSR